MDKRPDFMLMDSALFRKVRNMLLNTSIEDVEDDHERALLEITAETYEVFGKAMSLTRSQYNVLSRHYEAQQPRYEDAA